MAETGIIVEPLVVVAAVNDDQILENCLRRSPDIGDGTVPLLVQKGYASAPVAYNRALGQISDDATVIFAHQDVYFPKGYFVRLVDTLNKLTKIDANWGVAAPFGVNESGQLAGRVWSTAWNRVFQGTVKLPAPISSADELAIIVRARGLRFDENLPGFHLFATDIVQTALMAGRHSYAIDAPVIHHDKPVIALGKSYRDAYRFMRKKWWNRLPIPTLIVPVKKGMLSFLAQEALIRWRHRGRRDRPIPLGNPEHIAKDLGWDTEQISE